MTKRRKLTITAASLILVIAALYLVFMPALERARCCAWTLEVATWQRAVAQNMYEKRGSNQIPPSTFLRVIAEVDQSGVHFGRGVEAHCWDQKNESVRIGNISLDDILKGDATLADVDTEVARLNLPVPRWEVFDRIAFLVYNPGDQLRAELPTGFAISTENPDYEHATVQVLYEDGHAMSHRITPRYEHDEFDKALAALAHHNLPPLPDSFLSRLPQ